MATILILGAAGMLGRKLVERLAAQPGTPHRLILQDIVAPESLAATLPPGTQFHASDVAEPGVAAGLLAARPDIVIHLAAVVSGEAEADFEKGYRINLDGTRHLLEAIRHAGGGYRPRFVFASSLAVFGAPLPDLIPDDFALTPLTSYGTQKAMSELLVADYSRRGFIDGIGIRLPTVCVRPGKPNKAASGFFSGIIREPLNGQDAMLPVPADTRHWFASPRAAVGYLMHAATLDTAALGPRRMLTMPGIAASVARTDRGAPPRGRRRGGGAYPRGAGPGDPRHRQHLAARVRPRPSAGAGLRSGCGFRRDRADLPGRRSGATSMTAGSSLPSPCGRGWGRGGNTSAIAVLAEKRRGVGCVRYPSPRPLPQGRAIAYGGT